MRNVGSVLDIIVYAIYVLATSLGVVMILMFIIWDIIR